MLMTTRQHLCIVLVGLTVLSGCAGQDFEANATRPGKFRLYNCGHLDKRGTELMKRERELDTLMQKAKTGPGGELAVAIAYQNEYNILKGDLREIELMGTERRCDLKFRTSEQPVR
jgi:hypothetical protein